jgi:hypothetical protein
MIFIFLIMSVGCTGNIPTIPGIDPNPTENPDNSTVSYIKVSASSSTIKINQSLQLVVKGYNSDDEWVVLDKSKIKLWKWSVQGCYDCFKDYVDLNPKSGSLTTNFSSNKAGTFFIAAYYQENTGVDYITDYTEVKVNK